MLAMKNVWLGGVNGDWSLIEYDMAARVGLPPCLICPELLQPLC